MGNPYWMYDLATQHAMSEPYDDPLPPAPENSIFWSFDTPGGPIMVAQCVHPDSNQEHPDVPLSIRCELHQRTIYYCDDQGELWCDGGPPAYEFHAMAVAPQET